MMLINQLNKLGVSMKKILVIESSPNGAYSVSRKVSETLINKLKLVNQNNLEIKVRDLNESPVPHLSGQAIQAFFTPPENRTPDLNQAAELSDLLTDELLWADEIILSVPMWNFGVPSVVKAWIDHVSRAGKTFSFGPSGLVGLASGRKVYLIVASGSVFSEGPYALYDQLAPYLKTFFGFIGINDVHLIRAEGLNDSAHRELAIEKANAQIDTYLK
jgi:FMN-dependent NADH-azoreductase